MNDLPTVIETYYRLRPGVEGRRQGNESFFRCVNPNHADEHPSLRVNTNKDVWCCDPCDAGGRSIALVIHAGKARNEAEALAWFDSETSQNKPYRAEARNAERSRSNTPRATFHYTDERGNLLYSVERYDPKRFLQRSASGGASLKGIRRVPYRLPELRAAIQRGATIVVVEGEKDAEKLVSLGFVATTNAGGSSFAWPDDWKALFGGAKRIVVIADCDIPGRKAARARAGFLSTVCKDVRFLDLDPARSDGYDVSDFLASVDRDDLARIIEDAPRFAGEAQRVRLIGASSIQPVEASFLVAPYIPHGEATWLEGETKTGKTMVAIDLIARITRGTHFVNGAPIAKGRVAIVTCEDDPARTIVPRLKAADANLDAVAFFAGADESNAPLGFARELSAIEAELRQGGFALIFVDGTFGLLGVKDATSYTEAYETMLPFVAMLRRLGIAALIVRHIRKADASALNRGIGSVGYSALARSTLTVGRDRDDETGARRILAHAGSNLGELGPSFAFTIEGANIQGFERPVGRVAWGDEVDVTADEAIANRGDDVDNRSVADEFLYASLREPMTASELFALADQQRIPKRTLQRAARRLGITIERRGFGNGSVWHPPTPERPSALGVGHSRHWRQREMLGAHGANETQTSAVSPICAFFIGEPFAGRSCNRCARSWEEHAAVTTGQPEDAA